MPTIEIAAESLNAGCDTKGLFMLLKVRDVLQRHYVLFISAQSVHWYLRDSKPLPPATLAGMPPQPDIEENDWDGSLAHVLPNPRYDEYDNGLKLTGETQRGDIVRLTLLSSCQKLFRHYALAYAPRLVDLEGTPPAGVA